MIDTATQLYSLLQVGTSRAAGIRPCALPGELEGLIAGAGVPGEQADMALEQRLWLSLGAWSLWSRAGMVASTAPPGTTIAPAPAEGMRPCPPAAEALLAQLLQGDRKSGFLHEWLRELQRHGCVLPARMLPAFLDLATRNADLRPGVSAVLGERGRWLAQRAPGWLWAAAAADASDLLGLWETGSIEERQAALAQWRAEDPDAAREALAQAWSSEPPERRAGLLGCLAVRLGSADQAFLEAALDDRRKEVRTAAQSVLVRLPGSQLKLRMEARAAPLLHPTRSLVGRIGLEVSLPEAIDKAAARDGVGAAAHSGLGEKAGWLVDLLAATDLRAWSQRLNASPGDCLLMASRSDFAHAVVRGWASALVRGAAAPHALSDWTGAMLAFWLNADEATRRQYPRDFFDLFAQMESGALHALLADFVGASPRAWGEREWPLIELLGHAAARSSGNWPAALSRELVERLLRELPRIPSAHWQLRHALSAFASIVDPPAVAAFEAAARTGSPDNAIHNSIATFFDTVRQRHAMSLSFQEPA